MAGLVVDVAELAAALADQAARYADALFPDQTYLQHAQPSTVGHYLLAFAYPAIRDGERLLDVVDWVNLSPGGAGCVNGSRLVDDRSRLSALPAIRSCAASSTSTSTTSTARSCS